jgi:Xaa-Pro dipeptidase
MKSKLEYLLEAEKQAEYLFSEVENRGLICEGKTERELNKDVYDLAFELYGIRKYWHKRIVRAGQNTLLPYKENPNDLMIQNDDILFFDFGPVFEEWEADFGRTYVIGDNPLKHKLKQDVEKAWHEGQEFYSLNKSHLTGADFYKFTKQLACKYGWEYGNEHCGHLIGNFPHEKLLGEELRNYIHPLNNDLMSEPDINGNERYWIYEIHFVDIKSKIGGFFEQIVI